MKSDAILNFSNKIITAVIKIFLYGIIARSIGVEDYGLFVILISVFTVLSQLILFGSEYSIVNMKKNISFDSLIGYTLLKSLLVTGIIFLITIVFLNSFLALSISIYVGGQILYYMCQSIYLKKNIYKRFVVLNGVINILTLFAMVGINFSSVHTAIFILGVFKFILFIYHVNYVKEIIPYNLKQILEIYNKSFKFMVFEQLKFLHHRIDIIILSMIGLNTYSGYLGAIKNFVEATQYLPKTFTMILYKYSNKSSYIFKESYKLFSILFFILIVIIYIFGEFIITLIFGNDFVFIHEGLLISLVGAYFYSMAHLNMSSIVVKVDYSNTISVLVSVMYFINYIIFILMFGFYGALFSFVFSSLIYFMTTYIINKRLKVENIID